MKKSFYISFILFFGLLLTAAASLANVKTKADKLGNTQRQPSWKISELGLQHHAAFIDSVAENDFDTEKTSLDVNLATLTTHILYNRIKTRSSVITGNIPEFVYHYHLPKYLLFHNLKINLL